MCGGLVGFRRTISGGRPYCSLPILARTIGFSAGAPPAARSSRLLAACGDGVARYPIRYLWGREGAVVNTCMHGVASYPIRYQSNQGSSGLIGFVRVRQGSSGRAPIGSRWRLSQSVSGSSGFVRVRQGEHRLSSRWRLSPSSGAARNPLVRTLTGPRVVRTFRRPGGGRRVGSA